MITREALEIEKCNSLSLDVQGKTFRDDSCLFQKDEYVLGKNGWVKTILGKEYHQLRHEQLKKHEVWERVTKKIVILRVLNVGQEWQEMRLVVSVIGDGEHGQKTTERFLVGNDIKHVTEPVLKGT